MNTQKGFTIIELIVVVAIIAVLAAIVLINVTSYINKGRDAAIQGNLSTILTNATIYYDTNASYSSFCTNAYVTNPKAAITAIPIDTTTAANWQCNVKSTNDAWCACSLLKQTTSGGAAQYFCVDSLGTKKVGTSACNTECPAAGACI